MTKAPKTYYKFEPGDQILDLSCKPHVPGVVTGKFEARPDWYKVRLKDMANDVAMHAKEMKRA